VTNETLLVCSGQDLGNGVWPLLSALLSRAAALEVSIPAPLSSQLLHLHQFSIRVLNQHCVTYQVLAGVIKRDCEAS
jgi:hypothetical protein